MFHKATPSLQSSPPANYNSAIARAVEWLGDRYLLATPINTPMRSRASRIRPLGLRIESRTPTPDSPPDEAPRA
jgi:hypothetical protein